MEKKEFKVGETFIAGLLKLKCVEAPDLDLECKGCVFKSHILCGEVYVVAGPCNHVDREDGKDVIFIEAD